MLSHATGTESYVARMAAQKSLLRCGAAGAASFVLIFLVNDAVKPGYEPIPDHVSEAAIGPGGWVQIANFLIAGTLIAASSVAVSRAVNTWTGRLVLLFGVSLALAGVFVSDPVPSNISTWQGTTHDIVSVVAFASLTAACFTARRWRPTTRWRWYCVLSGLAVPALLVISGGVSGTAGVWQRLTIIVGWTWLAVLATRAARTSATGVYQAYSTEK
jgi:hypothetical membrane protein